MEQEKQKIIEHFIRKEMLQLNFRRIIVKKVCKNFKTTEEDALRSYNSVRVAIKKEATIRALIYLLLGSLSLFIGISGTFGNTGYIFWGALLIGTGSFITALGLFNLTLTKTK